ncbi:MAG: hypothetical protein HYZ33_03025, partial [Ignavibacteriales bacterium]|nr:hypothetical protein [Ignavibacteriales bacterium]
MKRILLIQLLLFSVSVIPLTGQVRVKLMLPAQMPSQLYEWERDPSLVRLVITNQDRVAYENVRISFVVSDATSGSEVARSKDESPSIPQFSIQARSTINRNGRDVVSVNAISINESYRTIAVTTNSLPEGQYTFCVRIIDERDSVLASTGDLCPEFSVVIPDPPTLLTPKDNDTIFPTALSRFSWTPVYISPGVQVNYRLIIAPMYSGQSKRDAIERNEPLFNQHVSTNSYFYLPSDPPFSIYPSAVGFAWKVQAVDERGIPVTRNEGRSETFIFKVNTLIGTQETILSSGCKLEEFPPEKGKDITVDIVVTPYEEQKKMEIQYGTPILFNAYGVDYDNKRFKCKSGDNVSELVVPLQDDVFFKWEIISDHIFAKEIHGGSGLDEIKLFVIGENPEIKGRLVSHGSTAVYLPPYKSMVQYLVSIVRNTNVVRDWNNFWSREVIISCKAYNNDPSKFVKEEIIKKIHFIIKPKIADAVAEFNKYKMELEYINIEKDKISEFRPQILLEERKCKIGRDWKNGADIFLGQPQLMPVYPESPILEKRVDIEGLIRVWPGEIMFRDAELKDSDELKVTCEEEKPISNIYKDPLDAFWILEMPSFALDRVKRKWNDYARGSEIIYKARNDIKSEEYHRS